MRFLRILNPCEI